jgi:6-phospho-beta-glucosidase
MKLAVIGGGSTYTPELIDGIARLRDVLPIEELTLIDPAADRLALVGAFADRILRKHDHPARLSWTSDLDAGVAGANVVLIQLRVGGQAARGVDETLPLQCDCVGQETTGAGGFAKALRTVPVVLDIAERIRKHAAADAWIVNFTNPVGIVTRALLADGHQAIGLCNVAIGNQRRAAGLLGVEPHRLQLDHVGLNHLTWTRQILLDGRDVLPELISNHSVDLADRSGCTPELLAGLGVLPSYYLRYYYAHDLVVQEQQNAPSRAEQVAAMEVELLDLYADPTLDAKPELLQKRGGAFYSEAAVDLVASLLSDRGDVQVVNVRNSGTFDFLADDAVIEVPARIGAGGAQPIPLVPIEPLLGGLIAHVSAYENLALDAAINGGRERIFQALLAHPLIGQVELADRLSNLLIAANSRYLPWST